MDGWHYEKVLKTAGNAAGCEEKLNGYGESLQFRT